MTFRIDDIWDLWRAGAVHMQNMSNQYGLAAQATHRSAKSQGKAFDGAAGEFVTAFTELRNVLQDQVLVTSSDNMANAGTSLANIAVRFSEQDGRNATELKTRVEGLQNGPIEDRPPGYQQPRPRHDDPHVDGNPRSPGY